MLAEAISYSRAVEREKQETRLNQGEAALASGLAGILPQPEFDDKTKAQFAPFIHWCETVNARYLPARPLTVASYILSLSGYGAETEHIALALDAIQAAHDYHGLASPVATLAVRAALEHAFKMDAPRAWRKEERTAFELLPAEIRAAIWRRERDRETALRRGQNELAEEKKRLRAEADESVNTEKETIDG